MRRCIADELPATISAALSERNARRVITPAGLPEAWCAAVPQSIDDAPPLSVDQLDAVDGLLTTVAVAIALTGTLVPDYHLAVVYAAQIVPCVPDAIAMLDPYRPLTWISGPSATSDMELTRVEGVHGPRTLDVIVVEQPSAGPGAGSTTLPA